MRIRLSLALWLFLTGCQFTSPLIPTPFTTPEGTHHQATPVVAAPPSATQTSTSEQTHLPAVTTITTATATATKRPTFTATPPPTDTPTPTLTPTPTPTPLPRLTQLTSGGCCVQPLFSPDSRRVLFIDKPAPGAPVGIYGVETDSPVLPAAPQLIYAQIGFRSPDHSLVAYPDPGAAERFRFVNEGEGVAWSVDTNGNWPVFSADGAQIFWNATDRNGPYDQQPTDIWVSDSMGRDSHRVLTIYGGRAEAWFPDGERLLVTGRAERVGEQESLFGLRLADNFTIDLAREERLLQVALSPGGSWVVYFSPFAKEVDRSGIWLVATDNSLRRKLDFFGPYRWRDDTHLVYIPLPVAGERMAVWEMDVEHGHNYPLTDPALLPIRIKDGDWALSPDGKKMVFVSATDSNLWLITWP